MSITAIEIVNNARTWINTPFHPQGRVKGVGCDCFGLIVGVSRELNLLSKTGIRFDKYDINGYHYVIDSCLLNLELTKHLVEIQNLKSGAIAIFKISSLNFHIAIVSEVKSGEASIIHACSSVGMVVENRMLQKLSDRIIKIFAFPQIL